MMLYKQKSVKDLYPPKDLFMSLAVISVALTGAVMFANFITSYAGL